MSINPSNRYLIDVAIQAAGMPLNNLRMCELGNQMIVDMPDRGIAKKVFGSMGVDHTSIDLNGSDGAEPHNLSELIETWTGLGRTGFDMLTNFGTSEHCLSQYNVFRNIHMLTRVGGVMIHSVPLVGYWRGHSPYKYEKSFFSGLASANGYEIILNEIKPRRKDYLLNVVMINRGGSFEPIDGFGGHAGLQFSTDYTLDNHAECNRKIFIDMGAHNGNTIAKAIVDFPGYEYWGYEPLPSLYKRLVAQFGGNRAVRLINAAVDVRPGSGVDFYEDASPHKLGSTMFPDKVGRLQRTTCNSIDVDSIFADITSRDYVILKIDIEGKEYDVLEHMLESGLMARVNKLYCEWHWHKISSIPRQRHDLLISRLRKAGFDITGDSKHDQYYEGL